MGKNSLLVSEIKFCISVLKSRTLMLPHVVHHVTNTIWKPASMMVVYSKEGNASLNPTWILSHGFV